MIIWSPREFNTVLNHFVNAAFDVKCAWRHWEDAELDVHIREGDLLKICVDVGLWRRASGINDHAALSYAV